jgi:hypothetical protein
MKLFPHERRRLDCLEGELRGEAPDLASKFDVFTRLAREDGRLPAERQFRADGAWRERAFARQRTHQQFVVIALVVLALLATVLALGLS